MRNPFLIIILVFFSIFIYAQKKDRDFPARYSSRLSNDTISTFIRNVGIVNNKVYSPYTWVNKMTLVNDGKELVVMEYSLDYLEITDLKGIKRKFIAPKNIPDKNIGLMEVLFQGKNISYYGDFKYQSLTQLAYREYFIEEGKEIISNEGTIIWAKKKLKARFINYPHISAKIDKAITQLEIVNVFKLYDEILEKK